MLESVCLCVSVRASKRVNTYCLYTLSIRVCAYYLNTLSTRVCAYCLYTLSTRVYGTTSLRHTGDGDAVFEMRQLHFAARRS